MEDLTDQMRRDAYKVMTLEKITRKLIQDLIDVGVEPEEAIKIVIGGKL